MWFSILAADQGPTPSRDTPGMKPLLWSTSQGSPPPPPHLPLGRSNRSSTFNSVRGGKLQQEGLRRARKYRFNFWRNATRRHAAAANPVSRRSDRKRPTGRKTLFTVSRQQCSCDVCIWPAVYAAKWRHQQDPTRLCLFCFSLWAGNVRNRGPGHRSKYFVSSFVWWRLSNCF